MKTYIILFVALAFVALLPPTTGKAVESPQAYKPVALLKPLSSPSIAKVAELDVIPITAQDYVYTEAKKYGWDTGSQWDAIHTLLTNESGWRWNAMNSSSGACGLFQALPCEKLGAPLDNVANQATWGLAYISRTYGSPAQALSMWYSRYPHWY